MIDTLLGICGLGVSVYSEYSGAKTSRRLSLQIRDIDESLSQLRGVVETTINKLPSEQLRDLWKADAFEIASQICNSLIQRSDNGRRSVEVLFASPSSFRYTTRMPEGIQHDDGPVVLILPETAAIMGNVGSIGVDAQLFSQKSAKEHLSIFRPEPIILRTPSFESPSKDRWAKKLEQISQHSAVRKEVVIDSDYWRSHLERLEQFRSA